jgi:hypothetical protein
VLSVVQPPCDVGLIGGAAETLGCATQSKHWVIAVTLTG